MNATPGYDLVISVVREHELTQRLFLASVELVLFAAVVGLVTAMFRVRTPRLAALLRIFVLVKSLMSLCMGSPIPLLRFRRRLFAAGRAWADPRIVATAVIDVVQSPGDARWNWRVIGPSYPPTPKPEAMRKDFTMCFQQ